MARCSRLRYRRAFWKASAPCSPMPRELELVAAEVALRARLDEAHEAQWLPFVEERHVQAGVFAALEELVTNGGSEARVRGLLDVHAAAEEQAPRGARRRQSSAGGAAPALRLAFVGDEWRQQVVTLVVLAADA